MLWFLFHMVIFIFCQYRQYFFLKWHLLYQSFHLTYSVFFKTFKNFFFFLSVEIDILHHIRPPSDGLKRDWKTSWDRIAISFLPWPSSFITLSSCRFCFLLLCFLHGVAHEPYICLAYLGDHILFIVLASIWSLLRSKRISLMSFHNQHAIQTVLLFLF